MTYKSVADPEFWKEGWGFPIEKKQLAVNQAYLSPLNT